jgi:uncharacterized repeat protein (TIGR03806 family)
MKKSARGKMLALTAVTSCLLAAAPGAPAQLVRQPNTTLTLSQSSPPPTLSTTGAFADLATLTPNAGIVPYAPNISFWSDYAQKLRWFSIPDINQTMTFAADANWTFPAGTIWIKHFNLPIERTKPTGPSRRIETRFLVKTASGVYGLSYQWRADQTDADLVASGGADVVYTVLVNGKPTNQTWRYPSRNDCLRCHASVAGFSLSFTTRQMNASHLYGSQTLNQIQALSDAGYFATPVSGVNNLVAYAKASDTTQNLEWRVRSYFATNCVQCHQPGGQAGTNWDARATTPTDQAQIINGMLLNTYGDPANRFVVPGDTSHSLALRRIEGAGVPRMPPLASNELDPDDIQLLTDWITQSLPQRLSFADWQLFYFNSNIDPDAAPGADPDGDGQSNTEEFLANTDPTNPTSSLGLPRGSLLHGGTAVQFQFTQPANRSALVETSSDLANWTLWDVPGNSPTFPPTAQERMIEVPAGEGHRFFRLRLSMP